MVNKPIEYTEELADRICIEIATSHLSLRTICKLNKDNGFPQKTLIYEWLYKYPSFADKYARAKEAQADLFAEQIIEISDDSSNDYTMNEDGIEVLNSEHVQRSRLRVDSRKWLAAKLKPKKYGDATMIKHANNEGGNIIADALQYVSGTTAGLPEAD